MNTTAKVLLALCASVAVGAALGVLFAPDKGNETRKKLMKRGKRLVGAVDDSIAEGRESLEEVKGVLQKQLTKVNQQLDDIRF